MVSLSGNGMEGRYEEKATDRAPHRRWLRPLLIIVSAVIILHLLTLVLLLRVIDLPNASPSLANLDGVTSIENTPGVGFDLTPSYGIAVVRHQNGSVTNVGRVPVDREMRNRFSVGGRVFHNDYASHCNLKGLAGGHSWSGSKKTIRKLLGLTSMHDVGRLAEVIGNLRRMTENHLGHPIEGVVVASPNFPALCNNDVEEAIRHAGLNPLSPSGHPYQPHEIATAYARHGFGLCKNNHSIEACNAEEDRLPFQQTLAVSHTSTAFLATLHTMKTAFITRDLLEGQHVGDYELGSDSHLKQDWNAYWKRVQLHIEALIVKDSARKPIHRVLLLGESGLDPNLLEALDHVISQHQDSMPEVYGEDPLYDAAQGAALFAMRAQEDQAFLTSEGRKETSEFEL